jgi:2-desacetyl-2-hydroxyethyl bacteriochlorophyllide A dehydrogenase
MTPMKTVICQEPGRLEVIEQPMPIAGQSEVLVRIRRIGICGTDMHIYQGNQPFLSYPRVMGHELSGEIAEAPQGSGLAPGQPVYIAPYLACGTCIACRNGKTNCCTTLQVLGVHRDGGMCEYLALPAANVVPTEGISLDEAAMVEFLAIGAHAVARGQVGAGQRVLVVGSGPIGMGAILFAGLRGAEVTALDSRSDRLALACERLGAAHAVSLGDGDADQLAELTKGEHFDVVFDATGNAKAMERGFGFVAHGGAYVFISLVRQDITFSDPEFHKREITLCWPAATPSRAISRPCLAPSMPVVCRHRP